MQAGRKNLSRNKKKRNGKHNEIEQNELLRNLLRYREKKKKKNLHRSAACCGWLGSHVFVVTAAPSQGRPKS